MKALFFVLGIISSQAAMADICGKVDDRVPSSDSRVARLVQSGQTKGCTATLVSNNCVITMGACAESKDFAEFNVPASIVGIPQSSKAEDTYRLDTSSLKFESDGIGSQWAVIKLSPNAITGKSAGEVQGFFKIAKKSRNNDSIKVIQYSYALPDAPYVKYDGVSVNLHADSIHFAQQVSFGKLVKAGIFLLPQIIEHNADTSYGSGAAPVIDVRTDELIGITTHGGCGAKYTNPIGARFTNSGTSIWGSRKFRKAILSCIQSDR